MPDYIVIAEKPMTAKEYCGIRFTSPKPPNPKDGMALYMFRHRNGTHEIYRVEESLSQMPSNADGRVMFYHLGTGPYDVSFVFSAVYKDNDENKWDLHLTGTLTVIDPVSFLGSFVAQSVTPYTPLSPALAGSWIANRIASGVHHNINNSGQNYTLEDLRDRHALPVVFWENQIQEWLNNIGVRVAVLQVAWERAQADAEAVEFAREKAESALTELRDKMEKKMAEYQEKMKEIEDDLHKTQGASEQEIEWLKKKHREELIRAEMAIKSAERKAEEAALEHELSLAQLRQDAEEKGRATKRQEQSRKDYEEQMKELEDVKAALERLANLPDNMQHFVKILREKATSDGLKINVNKIDLLSRDIGFEKLKVLPVNSSCAFEFTTDIEGFVTFLNIGTSGSVNIHVPNAYVSPEKAFARRGQKYAIPGSEMLPWSRLKEQGFNYVETGPEGWEHMSVLVSREPLIGREIMDRVSWDKPFIKLTTGELNKLVGTLKNTPSRSWSAGVLSFLVG